MSFKLKEDAAMASFAPRQDPIPRNRVNRGDGTVGSGFFPGKIGHCVGGIYRRRNEIG